MVVYIQREGNGGMSEVLGYGCDIVAVFQADCGEGMAEVMEADIPLFLLLYGPVLHRNEDDFIVIL